MSENKRKTGIAYPVFLYYLTAVFLIVLSVAYLVFSFKISAVYSLPSGEGEGIKSLNIFAISSVVIVFCFFLQNRFYSVFSKTTLAFSVFAVFAAIIPEIILLTGRSEMSTLYYFSVFATSTSFPLIFGLVIDFLKNKTDYEINQRFKKIIGIAFCLLMVLLAAVLATAVNRTARVFSIYSVKCLSLISLLFSAVYFYSEKSVIKLFSSLIFLSFIVYSVLWPICGMALSLTFTVIIYVFSALLLLSVVLIIIFLIKKRKK